MTAACRALETERPDGWVRDPLARALAGERGMAIAHALPALETMCFGVGMRSHILDAAITAAVAQRNIKTVLSIGAGLDTRPWRLDLPPALQWVEVDLQPMLDYKAEVLAGVQPKCLVQRVAADLTQPGQRAAMFAHAPEAPALMITEGLLMYLPAAIVEALAAEAASHPAIRYWLLDLSTAALSTAIRMRDFKDVEAMRAPDNLNGEGIAAVAARAGWTPVESHRYGVYAAAHMPPGRLESMMRAFASAAAPPPSPPPDDLSGVHLYTR